MRLLVTGAGGMLGHDILAAARVGGHQALPFTHSDLDVCDDNAVRAAVSAARPDAIINAAAFTNVDGAEADEATALRVNGQAPGILARAAGSVGAQLVTVSTDYVFDGRGTKPYVESDPVDPQSAYGRTKLAGERAVAEAGAEHAVVRSSWLFGVNGRNFVDTMLRLAAERDEVKVVTDQVGCPTWTGHLASALIAVAERRAGGILHVAGSGQCSWNELAAETFRAAGVDCAVLPATSEEMARPAPRPAYSVLVSERDDAPRLPDWREGLAGYLAARPTEVSPA